ncbi:MAG: hypothetical protein DSZ28_02330 [Thiothrix sp.]|nr:MAG: hypothetical protein DSZ28_02330 [Thiothrix sp.]
MSYRKKILNNSFFYGLAGYQETIIGMLVSILVARQLGAEAYGRYSLMMWVVALGVMLTSGGVVTSIIKFVAEQRGDKGNISIPSIVSYNLRGLYIKLPFTLLIIAILLLLIEKKLPAENAIVLSGIVLLAILPKALQAFYTSVLKGMENFKSLFLLNSIVTPINLLAVLYAVWTDGGIYVFLCLYLAITTLYYLVSRYYAKREVDKYSGNIGLSVTSSDKKNMNQQIKLLYLTSMLGFFVDRQMEVFFLNMLATPEAAAYYNVAFMLSLYSVELIPGLLVGVLLPVMAKSRKDGLEVQAYRYREIGRYLMLLTAPVVIFVAVFAGLIVEILYGAQYKAAAMPLSVLVLAAILAPLAGLANSILVSHERQKTVLKLISFTAILNIIIDYYLIKYFSLNGAVIGFSVIKLGLSVVLLVLASRIVKTRLDFIFFAKVIMLSVLAVTPLFFIKESGVPLLVFLLSGVGFTVLYFILLVQFRMITRDDIELLRHIKEKIPGKYEFLTHRLFMWMEGRQRL